MDPLEDPDYTLSVRVQDLGGALETSLSGNAIVHIVVQQNLWVNPGPITVKEHLKETYPLVIAKVWWDAKCRPVKVHSLYLLCIQLLTFPLWPLPSLFGFRSSLMSLTPSTS